METFLYYGNMLHSLRGHDGNKRPPARLERTVTRVAKDRGVTKSEVICSALTALEDESRAAHARPTPYAAMKHLIGCASGGPPHDLSVETGTKRDPGRCRPSGGEAASAAIARLVGPAQN